MAAVSDVLIVNRYSYSLKLEVKFDYEDTCLLYPFDSCFYSRSISDKKDPDAIFRLEIYPSGCKESKSKSSNYKFLWFVDEEELDEDKDDISREIDCNYSPSNLNDTPCERMSRFLTPDGMLHLVATVNVKVVRRSENGGFLPVYRPILIESIVQEIKRTTLKDQENKSLFRNGFLQEDQITDCRISCFGGKDFFAHRSVLSSASPVFASYFTSNCTENETGVVKVVDVEGKIMESLLGLIYDVDDTTKKLENDLSLTLKLIPALDKYGLMEMKKLALAVLKTHEDFSPEMICLGFETAYLHDLPSLKDICVEKVIRMGVTEFLACEPWKTIEATEGNITMDALKGIACQADR